jgi:hypothetical protein
MNERIKELALQVGGFKCSEDEWGFYDEDIDKFAELIIRECAKFSAEYIGNIEGITFGVDTKMLEYFGVE